MRDEHKIIQQVYAAKEDVEAADRLIGVYMPFIKAETAKYLKRPPPPHLPLPHRPVE